MTGTDLEQPSTFSLWLNILPFVMIAGGILAAAAAGMTGWGCALFLAGWIFLVPPLLGRILILAFGRPEGRLTQDQAAYRVWWVLNQLQTPFNRLPWLEELLRLCPGLYPLWIGLWGGRLSAFSYVGPGVIITDRYSVQVARGAVLGFGSGMAGHMVTRSRDGRWDILVATPRVEAEAILGGGAWLGPGAVLRSGHMLPANRRLAPFAEWPRP